MNASARRLATLAASAAVAAMVAVLPNVSSHAVAERVDVLAGAPAVGQCYDISRKAATDKSVLTDATVPCTKKHTLWVSAVVEVPADLVIDGDDEAYTQFVSRACLPGTKKMLGDNGLKYARSAYGTFTFHASDAQQLEGARWASCTIGTYGTARTLVRSKAAKPTKLKGALPRRLQLCGSARYDRVSCTAPHVFRATHATWVSGAISQRAAQSAADRTCPKHVRGTTWMWTSRPGVGRFSLTCLSR